MFEPNNGTFCVGCWKTITPVIVLLPRMPTRPPTPHIWQVCIPTVMTFNSLSPGKFEWNFRYLIFQITLVINGWGISCELALRWMSLYLSDDKSTLVQVMAWCRQATSHYLSQCWPRSLSPYGVTGPQCDGSGGCCTIRYRCETYHKLKFHLAITYY